jgi:TatD DNase family protein
VNSPAWVVEVARQVATLKDLPLETVGEVTSRNFATLFPGTRCGPATVATEP